MTSPLSVSYRPRTTHLPDERQSYLQVATVRPHRGPCPSCGAPEAVYCDDDCELMDVAPKAGDVLAGLARCGRCEKHLVPPVRKGDALVLPNSDVRHWAPSDGPLAICGLVSSQRRSTSKGRWAATRYRGITW